MEKKQSKFFKIADFAVTAAFVLVIIAAIVAGIIFVVKLVNETKTQNEPEIAESLPDNVNTEKSDITVNTSDNKKNVSVQYSGDFVSAGVYGDGQTYYMAVDSDSTYGIYFYALIPFSGIEVKCAKADEITLSLYAFDTDYETSVSYSPIYSAEFTNTENGSWLASFFYSVSAGEYLAVISSNKSAQIYSSAEQSDITHERAVIYRNGELSLGNVPYFNVIFDGQTANGEYFN